MLWACAACGETLEFVDLEAAALHLEGHGFKIDRWPDGSIVVLDETLEPEDFSI